MRVIKVSRDGEVTSHDGEPDFWMNEDICWAATDYPGEEGHYIYYDDEAMTDPGQVRIMIAGNEIPLPVWITGSDGHDTGDASISLEKVRKDLQIPG